MDLGGGLRVASQTFRPPPSSKKERSPPLVGLPIDHPLREIHHPEIFSPSELERIKAIKSHPDWVPNWARKDGSRPPLPLDMDRIISLGRGSKFFRSLLKFYEKEKERNP
jgi:hypothetical protein